MPARAVTQLIEALRKLPGVGPRAAQRMANHILKTPYEEVRELARAIVRARKSTLVCGRCFNFADSDPCAICSAPDRDATFVCVVERPEDVDTFERSRLHKGLYHVLGGAVSPSDDTAPGQLRIGELEERVKREGVKEVLIATNPTLEGETTAMALVKRLKPLGVKITRPAQGLPMGAEISVQDGATLQHALESRREL